MSASNTNSHKRVIQAAHAVDPFDDEAEWPEFTVIATNFEILVCGKWGDSAATRVPRKRNGQPDMRTRLAKMLRRYESRVLALSQLRYEAGVI